MLNTIPQIRAHVRAKIEELQAGVFAQPPADWAGFQKMLGRYTELSELQAELRELEEEDR